MEAILLKRTVQNDWREKHEREINYQCKSTPKGVGVQNKVLCGGESDSRTSCGI